MAQALATRLAAAGGPAEGHDTRPGAGNRFEPSLWIRRLSLAEFRSYRLAELTLDARPVVLTGANGAGKTNLLEALSLLTPGRGLRRARLPELWRQGATAPWAVAAEVTTPEGLRELGTGRDPALSEGESERRVVRLDGRNEKSQSAFAGVLDIVWLTPQMDGLWRDGASERRRFLDRLVFAFDPAHAGRVSGYETALRERARLLTEGRFDPAWLTALEGTMAERAVAIAAARRTVVGKLAAAAAATGGCFPQVGLALAGEVERWLADDSALVVEERLKAALASARRPDAETGGAAVGPHRSDLRARHLGKDMPAELCSTGEQKAVLIALVVAHAQLVAAERGRPPLLLLDEVAAHLDEERRQALYDVILALGAQAWLTGTDATVFAPLGSAAQHLAVTDSVVRRS